LLHLDEVRHLGHFVDAAEHFAQSLTTVRRRRSLLHVVLSSSKRRLTGIPATSIAEVWRGVTDNCWVCARAESGLTIWGPPGRISTHAISARRSRQRLRAAS